MYWVLLDDNVHILGAVCVHKHQAIGAGATRHGPCLAEIRSGGQVRRCVGEHTAQRNLAIFAVYLFLNPHGHIFRASGGLILQLHYLVTGKDVVIVGASHTQGRLRNLIQCITCRAAQACGQLVVVAAIGRVVQCHAERSACSHRLGQRAQNAVDGDLVGEVNANGTIASGQLLFEKTDLTAGQHTIQIVQTSATIDVDYFAYA